MDQAPDVEKCQSVIFSIKVTCILYDLRASGVFSAHSRERVL